MVAFYLCSPFAHKQWTKRGCCCTSSYPGHLSRIWGSSPKKVPDDLWNLTLNLVPLERGQNSMNNTTNCAQIRAKTSKLGPKQVLGQGLANVFGRHPETHFRPHIWNVRKISWKWHTYSLCLAKANSRGFTRKCMCVCVCGYYLFIWLLKKTYVGVSYKKKKRTWVFVFFFFLKVYIAHILKKTWAWKNQVFNNLLRPAPLFQ